MDFTVKDFLHLHINGIQRRECFYSGYSLNEIQRLFSVNDLHQ